MPAKTESSLERRISLSCSCVLGFYFWFLTFCERKSPLEILQVSKYVSLREYELTRTRKSCTLFLFEVVASLEAFIQLLIKFGFSNLENVNTSPSTSSVIAFSLLKHRLILKLLSGTRFGLFWRSSSIAVDTFACSFDS